MGGLPWCQAVGAVIEEHDRRPEMQMAAYVQNAYGIGEGLVDQQSQLVEINARRVAQRVEQADIHANSLAASCGARPGQRQKFGDPA